MNMESIRVALSRLDAWASVWEVAVASRPNQPEIKRWYLAEKCDALVRHDRILCGRQERKPS